jgi:hypothetical protein
VVFGWACVWVGLIYHGANFVMDDVILSHQFRCGVGCVCVRGGGVWLGMCWVGVSWVSASRVGFGLELFCMGLKAMRSYLARTLSYHSANFVMDGVILSHQFRCVGLGGRVGWVSAARVECVTGCVWVC